MAESAAAASAAPESNSLPSLEDVAKAAVARSAVASAGDMSGGTTSDPNIPEQGAAKPEAEAPKSEQESAQKDGKTEAPKDGKADVSSSRFAALARREKEARAREQQAELRAKELAEREKAYQEREARDKAREERWGKIKQDPITALKEAGISISDVVNAAYGNYKAPEEDPLDKRLNPLTKKFDEYESETTKLRSELKALQERIAAEEQSKQYNEVMKSIRETAGDKDKYELINAAGDESIDLIRDVMVQYFQQHQRMLDYSEACDIVEKYYEDSVLGKFSNTKKLQSRFGKPETPAATKPEAKPATRTQEPSTLTNKLATSADAKIDLDKLSKEDALAHLSKRLKFLG